jgi:hypothetical protein
MPHPFPVPERWFHTQIATIQSIESNRSHETRRAPADSSHPGRATASRLSDREASRGENSEAKAGRIITAMYGSRTANRGRISAAPAAHPVSAESIVLRRPSDPQRTLLSLQRRYGNQ